MPLISFEFGLFLCSVDVIGKVEDNSFYILEVVVVLGAAAEVVLHPVVNTSHL